MALRTTCIGAYPKADYVNVATWCETESPAGGESSARQFRYASARQSSDTEAMLDRATRDAIADQVACGIDIPSDGEQRREDYIHYHCRHLQGFDFENLTRKTHRAGAAVSDLPTIVGKVMPGIDHFLDRDFRIAQSCTDRPIKMTLPGPITIIDTTANSFYGNERQLAFDLADALNVEVRALAAAGCKNIQVDEPVFARHVDTALDFGIACLERCFDGLPDDVQRIVHMCCGYPGHLDDRNYRKVDPDAYRQLAGSLDAAAVDQISIEDAHRHTDPELLELFTRSTIIFGSVAIAQSRLETPESIADRLREALRHIDAERLIVAPDCGLIMLGRDLAMQKLANMSAAARSL